MSAQNSPEPAGQNSPDAEQDGSDLVQRLNGLMSTVGRRTQERDAAISRAEAAEAQLAELRNQLDSTAADAPVDKNRDRSVPESKPRDPFEALRGLSWEEFGQGNRR